jgi:thymidine phosphorylase
MLAQDIIRRKRDGHALTDPEIDAFVRGLVHAHWTDAQASALAMAICIQGLTRAETVALTLAMAHSGEVLDWQRDSPHGPVLDKHSTGGVGDKVSLLVAPIVAACGGYVPMVSGRGLGHTGGTLDKLASIPGYDTFASVDKLRQTLRMASCAIVGASPQLAPADARLYAIRDATATVESTGLITASILSKKLSAGLQGLVLDIKTGNGAFAETLTNAQDLASSLVEVATAAGLPTCAWITDMNQVLGTTCGNALEVQEAVAFLQGSARDSRLLEITRTLSAEMLVIGALAPDIDQALVRVDAALQTGTALEHFSRMVHALGGPIDLAERSDAYLLGAPVQVPVLAPRSGWVTGMATRAIGEVVIALGGGRRHINDTIDSRVGLSHCAQTGQWVDLGEVMAMVHAAEASNAQEGVRALHTHFERSDRAPLARPTLIQRWET